MTVYLERGYNRMKYQLVPNSIKYICHWDENFGTYLTMKRAEGNHYNVDLSHATKKLVRLICQL